MTTTKFIKDHTSLIHAIIHGNSLKFIRCIRAEDIFQDVSERIIKALPTLRNVECSKAWVRVITNRTIADTVRKKFLPVTSLNDYQDDGDSLADIVPSPLGIDESFEIVERLKQLAEPFRTALNMHAVMEMTYEEISVLLGIPLGTVKSRINRARRKIIEQIG